MEKERRRAVGAFHICAAGMTAHDLAQFTREEPNALACDGSKASEAFLMAPLAPNLTDTWFLDYVTGNSATSATHTMQVRLASPAGVDGATGAFLTLLNGIGPANLWVGWRALGLRKRAQGTTFSVPAPMGTALSAFVGTGSISGYVNTIEALEATVQGRSPTTGRRVDISIYGIRLVGSPTTFRYTATNGAPWSSIITAMQSGTNDWICVDGSPVTWYSYVNVNYNSYWEGQIRTA